jgi:hypothetical protein
MILVAIGYRWKNWRHQKQILKKFLQDEESRSRDQAQLQGQLGFAVGRVITNERTGADDAGAASR